MPQITSQASAYSVFGYAPQQLQKEASEVQSSATAQCCSHARSVRVHAVVVASEGRMVQANQKSMPSDGILKSQFFTVNMMQLLRFRWEKG
jgi:hypothetical protein